MKPVSISQLRTSATVDLLTAARALGLGRTKAYELARRGEFPCLVIRIGETYRIPTPGLLKLLGADAEQRPEPRPPVNVGTADRAAGPARPPDRVARPDVRPARSALSVPAESPISRNRR